MLIRFSVENYMSFKERQIFSMAAGKQTKHKNHVITVNDKRILKGSVFFGANAAGKSNLFKAVRFARNVVINGLKKETMHNKHFRLDDTCLNNPGVFQFDFFANGHFYSYGFAISYSSATVEEEWLYLCDTSETVVFERTIENGKTIINHKIRFSDEKQEKNFSVFSENVPDGKMLLLEISERKLIEHEDFSAFRDAMQWIKDLIIILPGSKYMDKTGLISDDETDDELLTMLKSLDTGIEDISLSEESAEIVLSYLPEKIRTDIIQEIDEILNEDKEDEKQVEVGVKINGRLYRFKRKNNSLIATQLVMNHGNANDLFKLADESDGTKRLFDLIPIYRLGRIPRVILVDELDRSFHTKLVQRFIQQFYEVTDGICSQLIACVHDSNVMDLDLLRQDEIWFVERQTDHSSRIYSLNRFKERFDKKIEKDYLLGRYGAIPCFSQIDLDATEEK